MFHPYTRGAIPSKRTVAAKVQDTIPRYPVCMPNYGNLRSGDFSRKIDFLPESQASDVGISIPDCLAGIHLQDPEGLVFGDEFGKGVFEVTVALMWPGYDMTGYLTKIPTFTMNQETLALTSRKELLGSLAIFVMQFFTEYSSKECRNPKWSLGPDNVRLEHIHICRIRPLISPDNIWQLEMMVVIPGGLKGDLVEMRGRVLAFFEATKAKENRMPEQEASGEGERMGTQKMVNLPYSIANFQPPNPYGTPMPMPWPGHVSQRSFI